MLAHITDEPSVLLGDDSASNPSELVLGSCIAVGIQSNLSRPRYRYRYQCSFGV